MATSRIGIWVAPCLLWILAGCASPPPDDPPPAVDDGEDAAVAPPVTGECPGSPECEDLGPLAEQGVATLTGASLFGMVDGPRGLARFDNPVNVTQGPDGRVYVADYNNDRVRVVTPDGNVATLVLRPDFERPFGLVVSPDGRTLYVQTDRNDAHDRSNMAGTIWRVDPQTGVAEVVARNLGRPRGIAVLPDGRLTLVDSEHHTIRALDPATGMITDIAGMHGMPGRADGMGSVARFNRPIDAVVDGEGNIIVVDDGNAQVRRITLAGEVTTIAGADSPGFGDGTALQARFSHPLAIAIDEEGNLYIADAGNYRVRRIATDGQVTTVVGSGTPGYLDGEPTEAQLFGLEGLDITPDGSTLYIADGNRGDDGPYHRVRRVMMDL